VNLFQMVALSGLAVLIAGELVRLQRGGVSAGPWLVRFGVWLAAMVAVARPGLLQALATLLGIGRGTDVLLYLLVFAFFGATFFLYARTVLLERQLTQLVRVHALANAERRQREQG
jgi:small membrane protein